MRPQSVRLALLLTVGPLGCTSVASTSGAAPNGGTSAGQTTTRRSCGQSTPYFEFQVERPAVRRSGPKPPTRTSRYMAQFVVEESGRADSASFRLLEQGDGAAGQGQRWGAIRDSVPFHTAWRALAASTFRPAEIRGCTVRMLMQEPATVVLPAGAGT